MTVKRNIERIERTIKKMERPKTKEDLKRDVIAAYGLPEDILDSEISAVVQTLLTNPDWPTLANPDYPITDDYIVHTVRYSSSTQFHDIPDDMTDEELLSRYHGYLDKVREYREMTK